MSEAADAFFNENSKTREKMFKKAIAELLLHVKEKMNFAIKVNKDLNIPEDAGLESFRVIKEILNKDIKNVSGSDTLILTTFIDVIGTYLNTLQKEADYKADAFYKMFDKLSEVISIREFSSAFEVMKKDSFIFTHLLDGIIEVLNDNDITEEEIELISEDVFMKSEECLLEDNIETGGTIKLNEKSEFPSKILNSSSMEEIIGKLKAKLSGQPFQANDLGGGSDETSTVMINSSVVKLSKPDEAGWRKILFE